MATEGHQSFNAETESVEQTGISSELKAVESDSNLRRKSLPYRYIDTYRSCSADGTYSRDTPLTISLPRETKTAFEDSTVINDIKAGDKEKRLAFLIEPNLAYDNI